MLHSVKEGIRRRALVLTLALTTLILLTIVLTGPMWAASVPSIALAPTKTTTANKQAPVNKEAARAANADQQTNGKAWLGIVVGNADGGAKVLQVLPNGPAAKAGVKRDDIITAVNNTSVANAKDVVNEVQKNKAGDKVVLSIKRGNDQLQIDVTAGAFPPRFNGNQAFGFRNLPPELKGLEGVPLREMFSHFIAGTFRMKDKDGQEVVVNITPGTVNSATSTSISINPNDGSAARQFDVSDSTVLVGIGLQGKVENLKAGTDVLIITVGDSTHASMIVRTSSAFNPMGDIVPGLRMPRLWQMPDRPQQFPNWGQGQHYTRPRLQPSM